MGVFEILSAILIGPLKILFEVIFAIADRFIRHPGPAIIVLSIAMNVLVLPLYRRADAIQIEARDTENRLKNVVTHIKKTFQGDERMMILQTYYRQNNYNPLSVLSSSVSLLLQIPFFMAAYQFLSGVNAFNECSYGFIKDLSKPDGLLTIGALTINVLPIIMTLVNVVSSALYLKGFPLKTKIQLYGMAAFFLVFLYNSPSALVFYWTLNNVFSLVKTLLYRYPLPKILVKIFWAALGVGAFFVGIDKPNFWRVFFFTFFAVGAQFPWLLPILKKKTKIGPFFKNFWAPVRSFLKNFSREEEKPNKKFFICAALFLTALVGLLIPSAYVSASPQEFIDTYNFYHPMWYVIHTLCISIGTFLVWMGVFYWLSTNRGKQIFIKVYWLLSGIMLVDYMFFGRNLGIMSSDLEYTEGLIFAAWEQVLNIAVAILIGIALYLLFARFSRKLAPILLVAALTLTGMGVINTVKIVQVTEETQAQISGMEEELPNFTLSKEGKNVVVIMLDRAIGPFAPYIFEERPELKEQFDGFTYYSNVLSYGAYTNFATPALYGGYDYTPEKMNSRDEELLVDKHNEALKVMPSVFASEGYNVTLLDPSYAGYRWIPELSVFDDMEGVTAYRVDGRFDSYENRATRVGTRRRNFFFFSLMKTLPVSMQTLIYNGGEYHEVQSNGMADTSRVSNGFMSAYNAFINLPTMTKFSDGSENTYMFFRSNLTHEDEVLQEPKLTPSSNVNNSAYYPSEGKTITAGDSSYLLDTEYKIAHYHVNLLAYVRLGEWFELLKQNGVYDNTRIIIVSDHGRNMDIFDQDEMRMHNIEHYLPLLLVKDFDSHGFTTSEEFMTNGDVPTLATNGLIESPVNPYTGNPINSEFKLANSTHSVILSNLWDVATNNGFQYMDSEWATVTTDSGKVSDKENWEFHTDLTALPPS